MDIPKQGIYKHYKGNMYEVTGIARHSETEEEMVVYRALYQEEGSNLWVRPLKMFMEHVLVNGKVVARFSWQGESPGQ
jgi:hypothetical protein